MLLPAFSCSSLSSLIVLILACEFLVEGAQGKDELSNDGEPGSSRGFIEDVAQTIQGAFNKKKKPGPGSASPTPPSTPAPPPPTSDPNADLSNESGQDGGDETCEECAEDSTSSEQECATIDVDLGEVCCGEGDGVSDDDFLSADVSSN